MADLVVFALVDEDLMSLLSLQLDGLPPVLWNELENEDGELSLDDLFFCTVAVPSVLALERVCDVVPTAVAGPSGGTRVPSTPATDSLRSALI